eukprot:1138905-Pelagomonas_calceolata.AAC.2
MSQISKIEGCGNTKGTKLQRLTASLSIKQGGVHERETIYLRLAGSSPGWRDIACMCVIGCDRSWKENARCHRPWREIACMRVFQDAKTVYLRSVGASSGWRENA